MRTGFFSLGKTVTRPAFLTIGRFAAVALLTSSAVFSSSSTDTNKTPPPAPQTGVELNADEAYGRLPIYFEPNRGQFGPAVRFAGRSGPATLYVTATEAAIAIAGGPDAEKPKAEVIRMKLNGARTSSVNGASPLPGISNYFVGNDPSRWITNVPQFGKVSASGVLSGIDVVYHGTYGRLEYDFVVHPGANPDSIRLAFDGVRSIKRDAAGDLLMETSIGIIKQHRPLVYQDIDGRRVEVASAYRISAGDEVSFQLAKFDASRPVVIDPVFDFSAVIPGDHIRSNSIALDGSNNSYIVGKVFSYSDYPLVNPLPNSRNNGNSQVIVLKLNSTGTSVTYSSVLGGSNDDGGYSIGVDNAGNAYISGETLSPDFPTANARAGHVWRRLL